MSVAPVPDVRNYDTIYQERYVGLPQHRLGGLPRRLGDQLREGIEGDLLVVHGTRRRQRALPGHRAAGERARRGGQTVPDDGVSEPVPRDLRGPGHDGPSLQPAHPVPGGETGAAPRHPPVVFVRGYAVNRWKRGRRHFAGSNDGTLSHMIEPIQGGKLWTGSSQSGLHLRVGRPSSSLPVDNAEPVVKMVIGEPCRYDCRDRGAASPASKSGVDLQPRVSPALEFA